MNQGSNPNYLRTAKRLIELDGVMIWYDYLRKQGDTKTLNKSLETYSLTYSLAFDLQQHWERINAT